MIHFSENCKNRPYSEELLFIFFSYWIWSWFISCIDWGCVQKLTTSSSITTKELMTQSIPPWATSSQLRGRSCYINQRPVKHIHYAHNAQKHTPPVRSYIWFTYAFTDGKLIKPNFRVVYVISYSLISLKLKAQRFMVTSVFKNLGRWGQDSSKFYNTHEPQSTLPSTKALLLLLRRKCGTVVAGFESNQKCWNEPFFKVQKVTVSRLTPANF